MFDKVFDRFGKEYALADLEIQSTRRTIGSSSINSLSSYSCTNSGYFDLYFAAGSYFDGPSSPFAEKRDVLCQVFKDISDFIISPLAAPGNTVRINIYCDNVPLTSPGTLATAGAFYVFPANPTYSNQGIIDNQINKTLVTGQDAYANYPVAGFIGAANFFHGVVNTSFNPPSGTFNYALNTNTITNTQVDYYSVMLHEIFHALGIGSLINGGNNGISQLGASSNFYSRYDLFLQDAAGNPLLGSSTPLCPLYNLTYTAPLSVVNPSNCSANSDLTNCTTAAKFAGTNTTLAVFTPSCWVNGSSLSHFEDMCTVPPSFTSACNSPTTVGGYNNLYYVMSNSSDYGTCYIKRYPKPEERFVL